VKLFTKSGARNDIESATVTGPPGTADE